MEMDRFTLRFRGELEAEFLARYFRHTIRHIQFAVFLSAVLYAAFGALDYLVAPADLARLSLIRFGVVVPFLILCGFWSLHRSFERWGQLALSTAILVAGLGVVALISAAPEQLGGLYHSGLILVILGAYVFFRLRFIYATAIGWLLMSAAMVGMLGIAAIPVEQTVATLFYVMTANIIGMSSSYTMEVYARRDFRSTRLLEAERAKSERLLLNVLPPAIADRLKQDEGIIADRFAGVSVLFADIVDFTELSSRISADEVVALLNDIFSAFDHLAERYGLEKIKTIGDAYMVVGGLTTTQPDHAEAVIALALAMHAEMPALSARQGRDIQLRIGVNTGPVVAGVIGTKKFIYDLWGDTVNTASRMESHGVAGRIQVAPETYERLRHRYDFEPREGVEVKGKGLMTTYLLTLSPEDARSASVGGSEIARSTGNVRQSEHL